MDISDILPNHFKSVNKPMYIISTEGIDAFIVKNLTIKDEKTIELVFYDAISPKGAQKTMEWVRQCWEYEMKSTTTPPVDPELGLKVVDQVGTVIRMHSYQGARITDVKFADGPDYEFTTITATISFDSQTLDYDLYSQA